MPPEETSSPPDSDETPAGAEAPLGTVLGVAGDARELLLVENATQWQAWLDAHHGTVDGVWLVSWRGVTGRPRLTYEEAIEAALSVGWIDSQIKRMDEQRTRLLFTPRRKGSAWSASNKQRVARLEAAGRLRPAGRAVVDRARSDGSWQVLDAVERMEELPALTAALDADPSARRGYDQYPASVRKQVLFWVASAKRPETRERRIATTVAAALEGRRPNGF